MRRQGSPKVRRRSCAARLRSRSGSHTKRRRSPSEESPARSSAQRSWRSSWSGRSGGRRGRGAVSAVLWTDLTILSISARHGGSQGSISDGSRRSPLAYAAPIGHELPNPFRGVLVSSHNRPNSRLRVLVGREASRPPQRQVVQVEVDAVETALPEDLLQPAPGRLCEEDVRGDQHVIERDSDSLPLKIRQPREVPPAVHDPW